MVVQAEVTSTNANTGEMLKDSVECLAVLSDRICSFGAIDDGSSEQKCSIVGWKKRKILANKVYCERR